MSQSVEPQLRKKHEWVDAPRNESSEVDHQNNNTMCETNSLAIYRTKDVLTIIGWSKCKCKDKSYSPH